MTHTTSDADVTGEPTTTTGEAGGGTTNAPIASADCTRSTSPNYLTNNARRRAIRQEKWQGEFEGQTAPAYYTENPLLDPDAHGGDGDYEYDDIIWRNTVKRDRYFPYFNLRW